MLPFVMGNFVTLHNQESPRESLSEGLSRLSSPMSKFGGREDFLDC